MIRRRRTLYPDEERLWRHVADSAIPLHPQRDPAPPRPTIPPAQLPDRAEPAGVNVSSDFRIGARAGGVNGHPSDTAQPEAVVRMDRKAFQRLSRGKLVPEGRIDLHGMTLAAAQPALTGFILRAHAAGKRLVLVITGKGRTDRDPGGPIPERPGALRREVPLWLSRPPLASLVLQMTEAHRRHGGSGAYYIYLRRPGR